MVQVTTPQKIALVFGSVPLVEEVEQFCYLAHNAEISLITSYSIAMYLKETLNYPRLSLIALPDYDDNATYLPSLEQTLNSFNLVIIKDRLGLYAYQVLKAKGRFRFRLLVWIDNLVPYVGQDITRIRTIRTEVTNIADGFMVQSESAYQTLLLEGVNKERIYFVNPFCATYLTPDMRHRPDAVRHAKQQLGLLENDLVLGYFGDMEWEEGLYDLLYGLHYLFTTKPSFARRVKLVVSGIGSFSGDFKQRSIDLKIDQNIVYILPHLSSKEALLVAVDAIYLSPISSKDRTDGNPFRYLNAMVHGIPVIASRNPICEETIEKHRIDFCLGNVISLSQAMEKSLEEKNLTHNITSKNQTKALQKFSLEKAKQDFSHILGQLRKIDELPKQSPIDELVLDVEGKVFAKQYLQAVDLIENIFAKEDVPPHHRANLLRLVGDCFIKLGDQEAGKNAYLQSIEIDPFLAKSHIGLGTTSLMKQQFEIGIIHFQKAITLAPKDEMAALGMGLAFQGLDEWKEANKWVMMALEINPENTAAIYSLVRIAEERNEFYDAVKVLRTFLSLHPYEQNLTYTLAGILYKIEEYDDVIALLSEITSMNPMDSRAQTLLRQARKKQDKRKTQGITG